VIETTTDGFLGGSVTIRQPTDGFRSGLDAVMLAAAVPAMTGQEVLELGAGCGTASLCLAVRVPECAITGVEIEPDLVALARVNAKSNAMEGRVRFVEADIFAMPATLKHEFAHAFANPPFHHMSGQRSEDPLRGRAKHNCGRLDAWLAEAFRRVVPNGTVSIIVRADRLSEVMSGSSGGSVIFPLWPRRAEPARRVIVQLRKGSAAPTLILPGLVLHEHDGRYTNEADAVLRGRARLELARQAGADGGDSKPTRPVR
jgi:tRNA1(Val) A37 N6-methylase TrmN6